MFGRPSQLSESRGHTDQEIGQELTVGGGKRYRPAGLYFSAARDDDEGVNVPGFGQPMNGSEILESSRLQSKNIDQIIEHGSINRQAGLAVKIHAKKWDCQWHQQYLPGTVVFSLDINSADFKESETSSDPRSVGLLYPQAEGCILLTPAQLQALLDESGRLLNDELEKEGSLAGGKFKPVRAGDVGLFTMVINKPEELWMDPNTKETDAYHDLVRQAYAQHRSLGFCNGKYLQRHLHLLGVVESATDSGDEGSVMVAVAVAHGAHTINYWGAHLETMDKVGFVITKRKDAGLPASDVPSDYRRNSFVLISWRHPSSYTAGVGMRSKGIRMTPKDMPVGRYYSYDYLIDPADETSARVVVDGEPSIQYNLGFAASRDEVDYSRLAVLGEPDRYSRKCFGLLGLAAGGRVETVTAHANSLSIERSIYVHICTMDQ